MTPDEAAALALIETMTRYYNDPDDVECFSSLEQQDPSETLSTVLGLWASTIEALAEVLDIRPEQVLQSIGLLVAAEIP